MQLKSTSGRRFQNDACAFPWHYLEGLLIPMMFKANKSLRISGIRLPLIILWSMAACQSTPAIHTISPSASQASVVQVATPSLTAIVEPTKRSQAIPIITPSSVPQDCLAVLAVENHRPGVVPNPDLYIMGIIGDTIVRITAGNAAVESVAWSPDGERLAFAAANMPGRYQYDIYIVNADGSHLTRLEPNLTGDVNELEPNWSPDGRQIAFSKGGQILVINVGGNNARLVTEGSAPFWSPDGRSIVFVRRHEQNLFGDIFVSDKEGEQIQQLTDDLYANRPAYSPDGTQIAFYGYDPDGQNGGIYVMNADGSNINRLTEELVPPSWTPDGKHLLYASAKNAATGTSRLYLINTGNSRKKVLDKLPENFLYLYAVWRPVTP
jgi:Tol biopolymer transport system component